jgi:hypothetical protein
MEFPAVYDDAAITDLGGRRNGPCAASGMATSSRLLIALASVLAIAVIVMRLATRAPMPPRPSAAAARGRADEPRVIASVGPTKITSADLARYQVIRQLSVGVSGERQSPSDS